MRNRGRPRLPAVDLPRFPLISVNNVTMRYGARILFEDVTTTFFTGRRYAVTGPNGAGKSTFMKILTGDWSPRKAGHPPQEDGRPPSGPVCIR